MNTLQNIVQQLQGKIFDSVVSNRLVYNTCWEDPRIDRQLLKLDNESEVVMLGSAGCNALDYLLDEPNTVHCIDANPAQNALVDLKKALFEYGDYDLMWNLLGKGHDRRFPIVYRQHLSHFLSPASNHFWNRHINYFSRPGAVGSFYFRGTSGKVAMMIHNRLKRKGVYSETLNLLNAATIDEQRYYYREIKPQLWSAFYKWLFNRKTTMALLGVPGSQKNMIDEQVDGGVIRFIDNALQRVFTQLPVDENYFWRVYLTGSYTPECCPNYLKKTTFEFFRREHQRIRTYNSYLHTFLEQHPGSYSHFILLDHQDWLAGHQPDLLAREWRLILENARVGAKILFRSAGKHIGFLPSFVFEEVTFENALTDELHNRDRVATYGSTWLAEVNK